ncbi:sialic acid-binding Ig-like lectin 12 [Bufo gargarizans]|uniref:sialic acid-binding Ig-like lectin 12 n=1 Tax=Bufo gargarizans TaxID=30331 RepID=UPI001CF21C78|nr:sialic acid-binding Ig-like lectin 12 [Bufo gargarizans]
MKSPFDCLILTFCLFVLPGHFAALGQTNWTFTLPESIEAPINSTVEIPCTFTAPDVPGKYDLTWYKYGSITHEEVYNSDNQSRVHPDYIHRTFHVGNGTNCSLTITGVRETAWYFPAIRNDSFNISSEQKPVKINVTGCTNRSTCSSWSFTFPRTITALDSSCVEIPCTLTHPANDMDFNLVWFLRMPSGDVKVYDNKTRHNVDRKYVRQTSLLRMRRSSCALKINNIKKDGQYYPGINQIINAYNLDGKVCTVTVSEFPQKLEITGTENLKESIAVNISCAINHTCGSSPPELQWNIKNDNANVRNVNRTRGTWTVISEISYLPSSKDNNSPLECKATFQNGVTSVQTETLLVEASADPNVSVITISVLAVIACLVLIVSLVFIYRRTKCFHASAIGEVGESPELTYTTLNRREVAEDYDTLKFDNRGNAATGNENDGPYYENIQL